MNEEMLTPRTFPNYNNTRSTPTQGYREEPQTVINRHKNSSNNGYNNIPTNVPLNPGDNYYTTALEFPPISKGKVNLAILISVIAIVLTIFALLIAYSDYGFWRRTDGWFLTTDRSLSLNFNLPSAHVRGGPGHEKHHHDHHNEKRDNDNDDDDHDDHRDRDDKNDKKGGVNFGIDDDNIDEDSERDEHETTFDEHEKALKRGASRISFFNTHDRHRDIVAQLVVGNAIDKHNEREQENGFMKAEVFKHGVNVSSWYIDIEGVMRVNHSLQVTRDLFSDHCLTLSETSSVCADPERKDLMIGYLKKNEETSLVVSSSTEGFDVGITCEIECNRKEEHETRKNNDDENEEEEEEEEEHFAPFDSRTIMHEKMLSVRKRGVGSRGGIVAREGLLAPWDERNIRDHHFKDPQESLQSLMKLNVKTGKYHPSHAHRPVHHGNTRQCHHLGDVNYQAEERLYIPAWEVHSILPSLHYEINSETLEANTGGSTPSTFGTVRIEDLLALAISSIQQLNSEIEDLKQTVAELQSYTLTPSSPPSNSVATVPFISASKSTTPSHSSIISIAPSSSLSISISRSPSHSVSVSSSITTSSTPSKSPSVSTTKLPSATRSISSSVSVSLLVEVSDSSSISYSPSSTVIPSPSHFIPV